MAPAPARRPADLLALLVRESPPDVDLVPAAVAEARRRTRRAVVDVLVGLAVGALAAAAVVAGSPL